MRPGLWSILRLFLRRLRRFSSASWRRVLPSNTCNFAAEPRIEIGVADIRQRLGSHGHAHGYQSAGFDQINILVQAGLQEEGTKAFVDKEELDHIQQEQP